jgi:calcium-translocating P-type ATPase
MGKFKFEGLSSEEVLESIKRYGKNELPPPTVETFWDKLKDNFDDPLIKILIVALFITMFLALLGYAEWIEGIGIATAVILATFVATFSEHKNEESFQKLQEKASRVKNNVFRNSEVRSFFVYEIVMGDYVLLEPGDKIPADGVLIAGTLKVNQMWINGEPEPVRKTPTDVNHEISKDDHDEHLVFRGTVVEEGDGVMLVKAIGTKTVYGEMLDKINEEDDRESPLQVKLTNLADGISTLGYIGATFIFLSFLFKQFVMDQGFSMTNTVNHLMHWQAALKDVVTALILSIIIIVVAVPEGLPMMIAIVLSINMKHLLDQQVLVRRLLGIETAGSLNVLFSDKTGTITCGVLEPHNFVTADLEDFNIHEGQTIPPKLNDIFRFCVKNSSSCHCDKAGNIVGGNSSDRAFMSMIDKPYLQVEEPVKRVSEILFNSALKFSAVKLVANPTETIVGESFFNEGQILVVKGAPEKLLPYCTQYYKKNGEKVSINEVKRDRISDRINEISDTGIRVIAIATSDEPELDNDNNTIPSSLSLVGFIGLRDEIRPSSKSAIKLAKSAGIQVVMITGDRKETAISIAKEVGLIDGNHSDKSVITSDDLKKLTEEELQAILPDLRVIARALPSDKSRLVDICESLNLVVGMTGDGVNDAAALKKADVGFAMGSGTEMAKEAADIVIMDDNFNSITKAILYGRTIFKSIRKFIIFQSTINVASTLIVFLGPFLRIDFPLTLIQLLWVNLVMDTLAALAFGGEPALESYMNQKPIRRDEAIVSPYMWTSILTGGISVAMCSIYFLMSDDIKELFVRDGKPNYEVFLSAFFGFYIFITTINAFNVRTKKFNLSDNITGNRGFFGVITVIFVVQMIFTYLGGNVLRTVPLTLEEWGYIFKGCFIIIPLDLIRKAIVKPILKNRRKGTNTSQSKKIQEPKTPRGLNNSQERKTPRSLNSSQEDKNKSKERDVKSGKQKHD